MRIIIVGSGKMGYSLAETLIREGHDIILIDRDEAALARSMDTLDALFIKGSGVSVDTLTEADAQHADLLIATTVSDETNMLCCLTGKRLGVKYAVARIRDPEYLAGLPFLQKELSIDYAINPERATAREISRMLRFPFADNVETFARGRVEMMDFRAVEGDPVVGVELRDLSKKHKNLPQVLFCAVERDHTPIIPRGDFVIQPGDRVFVASDIPTVTSFFNALGKNVTRIKRVMLMGGSRIAYYLATMLISMGMHVSLIEINKEKARLLSETLPDANIIFGDGTDQELLDGEGLAQMDAFVTLSDRDEENFMAGLYATRCGVKKVIVKNNRVNYSELMTAMGLDSIVNPKQVICNSILRTVRARSNVGGTAVERMYRLMDGKAEALEFIAKEGQPYINVPLKNLNIRETTLVAVIVREGHVRVPFGNDVIEVGDSVIIITKDTMLTDLGDMLSVKR